MKNFLSMIRFDFDDDFLRCAPNSSAAPRVIFMVCPVVNVKVTLMLLAEEDFAGSASRVSDGSVNPFYGRSAA